MRLVTRNRQWGKQAVGQRGRSDPAVLSNLILQGVPVRSLVGGPDAGHSQCFGRWLHYGPTLPPQFPAFILTFLEMTYAAVSASFHHELVVPGQRAADCLFRGRGLANVSWCIPDGGCARYRPADKLTE